MTPEATRFVEHFGLQDVRQCGSVLRVAPADYWMLANKWISEHPEGIEEQAQRKGGFLAQLDGFGIYLDADVAGTGRTIADDAEADMVQFFKGFEL